MKRAIYVIRQTIYTVFSFCCFLLLATEMTIRGFILLTLRGNTKENKLKYHRILQKKAEFAANHVPGATFSYSNPSKEDFEKPAMIICNHQSHLDLMPIMMLTPKMIILTKDWVWHNPFYGIVIRYADFFPITDTEEMIGNLKEKVEEGYSIMVFPEGTRSEDGRILRFHRGAFYMAEALNLDIVPVIINGIDKVLPKKSFHLHPGHMSLEVMSRIHRDNKSEMPGYREITKRMHKLYLEKKS